MTRRVGTRVPTYRIGSRLGRELGRVWPLARTGADLIYQFEMPFIVDGSAFTRRFGGRPTPYDDGVGETLAWYTAGRPSALALDPHGAADVPYPRDGNASRGRPSSGAVPTTATGR